MREPFVAAGLALALAAPAAAAAPVVAPATQRQLKIVLGGLGSDDLAYIPSHVPAHYGLNATQLNADESTLTFTDPKYAQSSAAFEKYAINFTAKPFKSTLAKCAKGSQATRRVAGRTVYWKRSNVAWRCVRAPSGNLVEIDASSPKVGRSELELVVTSAKRIG